MARRRTKLEREDDLVQMAHLRVRGVPQVEIAKKFNLSQAQVSKDLAEIRRRWRQTSKDDLEIVKYQELTKLELLQKTHWQAWELSQKPKEIISKKQVSMPGATGASDEAQPTVERERNEASLRTEERDGSVPFLREIRECIKLECDIHGLIGQKLQLTGDDSSPPIRIINVHEPKEIVRETTPENVIDAQQVQDPQEANHDSPPPPIPRFNKPCKPSPSDSQPPTT